jgi:RHH-type proline utilization regulon transcriptional repressor/proline dehydrogenase/delta 1-pyrroline-5-carboxylate dehydrogenase
MQHLAQAVISYDAFALQELLQSHDTVRLVGQDNIRRYKPISRWRIRLSPHDTSLDIVSRIVAATAVGAHATVSQPPGVHDGLMGQLEAFSHLWTSNLEFIEESDGDLIDAIERGEVDRLRYAGPAAVPLAVREMANRSFIYVADNPVCTDGRIELLWYVCEQSLSVDYHRYGNLGFRADETRRPVL